MTDPTDAPAAPASPQPDAAATPAPAAPVHPEEQARRTRRLSMLVLGLLSVGMFLQTLNFPLVYDDFFVIDRNASMEAVGRSFVNAFDLFRQEYWAGVNPDSPEMLKIRGQGLYRPLSIFLWAIIYSFHGSATTWGYHLLNMLLHAGVVLVLYRLVAGMFGSQRIAFVSALLFAIHPLHSEAVAYVAGLHDVLSALGVLVGLHLFVNRRGDDGSLTTGAVLGMLAALFVGLLAKEQAVLLLPAVILTDVTLSLRGRGLPTGQRVALYGSMAVVVALHVVARYAAVGYLQPVAGAVSTLDNPLINEGLPVRLANGLKLMAKAVWLFLWPAQLSIDYSFNAIPVSPTIGDPEPLAAAILIATMLVLGIAYLRRWTAVCWGILLFLGCVFFTSNIITPIGTIFAERLLYLGTAGACVTAAAVLDRFVFSRGIRPDGAMHPLALLLIVAVTAGLGIRTVARNFAFRSSYALFEAAEQVVPLSARVHFQLGGLDAKDELFNKAEVRLRTSLELLGGTFTVARVALGDLYISDKNYDAALREFETVLAQLAFAKSHPEVVDDTRRMAMRRIAEVRKELGELDAAEDQYAALIESAPDDPAAYIGLAEMLINEERPADALPWLHKLLDRKPGNVHGLRLMARAAGLTGDREGYERSLDGLLATKVGRPHALCLQAEQLYQEGRDTGDDAKVRAALDRFDEARALDDTMAVPYMYRGRHLAELGRPFDALVELDRALERDPRHPGALLYKVLALFDLRSKEAAKEALQVLSVLEAVNPNAACYELMIEAYFRLGQFTKMDQTLERLKALGKMPVQVIAQRAFAYEDQGDLDTAVETIREAMRLEGYERDPRLMREMGRMLLKAERYAEARAAFTSQMEAEAADPGMPRDPYLAVNMARAYMGSGRDVEAARELERFEQSTDQNNPQFRASLLNYKAELFLRPTGPFFDPAGALDLCREGQIVTDYRHPPFFDLAVEALLRAGDLGGALSQASEAAVQFPAIERYQTLRQALELASEGDGAQAVERLRGAEDAVLVRLADLIAG